MKEEFTYAVVSLFGYDEPILVEDVLAMYPGMSRQAVYKKLEAAMDEGRLARYGRGIYYIPRQMRFGQSSPSAIQVAKRRWMEDFSGNVFGYVSGAGLANEVGISEQIPAVLEVTTNKESSRVREVTTFGGWKKILLRRPRRKITNDNVDALRFLDLVTEEPINSMKDPTRKALSKLAAKAGRANIYECVMDYPSRTAKKLAECERCLVFA